MVWAAQRRPSLNKIVYMMVWSQNVLKRELTEDKSFSKRLQSLLLIFWIRYLRRLSVCIVNSSFWESRQVRKTLERAVRAFISLTLFQSCSSIEFFRSERRLMESFREGLLLKSCSPSTLRRCIISCLGGVGYLGWSEAPGQSKGADFLLISSTGSV